jgi:hypothetical protein
MYLGMRRLAFLNKIEKKIRVHIHVGAEAKSFSVRLLATQAKIFLQEYEENISRLLAFTR